MAWTSAKDELRALLNDGPTDKLRHLKRVIGNFNGSNITFKTFEFRRLTNFVSGSAWPYGVFKNDSSTPETVTNDDPATGAFKLSSAPAQGDILEATYYIQYFTDDELIVFLKNASRWLTSSDTYDQSIQGGLQSCALKFAAAEAYQKLVQRDLENLSTTYRTEDAPDEKNSSLSDKFMKMAESFREQALKERDEFYEDRQGQAKQPLFGTVKGNVKDVAPRR